MTVEELLYAHLIAHSGLMAVVGNRIYPMVLPQEATLPAVRYQFIGRQELHVRPQTPLLTARRYQLDGYAASYAVVNSLEGALKAALYGFNKTVNPCIFSTFIDSMRYEDDPEVGEYGISMDAIITCSE